MNRVHFLVAQNRLREALVCLWVMARTPRTLVSWERGRVAARFDEQVSAFAEALEREREIAVSDMDGAPLAFVRALDEVCRRLSSAQPFVELPYEEAGEQFWLIPVEFAARQDVSLARQAGNLLAWFRFHAIVPAVTPHGIRVTAVKATGRQAQALGTQIAETGVSLRVWVAHAEDGSKLMLTTSPAGKVRALRIEPFQDRLDSIRSSLVRAQRAGAVIVVFPELSVDHAGRRMIAQWLRENRDHPFQMIVAGSFHEELDSEWYNASAIWNRMAEPVVAHRKLRVFGDAFGLAEDILPGDAVSVLVTPVGSFMLLICKDFLDADVLVASLLQEVPVDWVLVPSYGDAGTVSAHQVRAKTVARVTCGATCVVANQRNVEATAGPPLPGFVHVAGGDDPVVAEDQGSLISVHLAVARSGIVSRPRLVT